MKSTSFRSNLWSCATFAAQKRASAATTALPFATQDRTGCTQPYKGCEEGLRQRDSPTSNAVCRGLRAVVREAS
ncbi:hypothetical protein FKP32DRAFT_233250 [Trametes sanguinea]|nr:hypothetical protein FKP32DRAFT_233250 [Trametes sanguinea]